MADRPNREAVDSRGFDEFLTRKGSRTRKASDLGISGGKARWPTADEVSDAMKKQASSGVADVGRTSGQFLDPAYFDPLLFFIQHRDRRELNFRLRHAYEYEPVVGNLIDLHRTMPLSDYRLVCRDKSVEGQMHSFAEQAELLTLSSYILGDYFLLGEAILWKVWDDYNKTWKTITLLPPEKIELRKTYLTKTPLMLLHVDSELKRLVTSADPVDQEIVKQMDPILVEKIGTKDRIALPPHQAVHFANKTSESDLRGTSILKRGLYALLLKYKLRLLHSTYVDRGTFPLKIFKVGHPESKWVPSRSHFDALRNMLAAAANDPDFNIIYHYGLEVEYHGAKDKWENLLPHYEWCDKELMMALFGNEALLQSKGTTFCFDDQTEVLTDNGWKRHDEVIKGDLIGTFNQGKGSLEFQKPEQKHVYDYNGDLLHFKNQRLDVMVTPNHRMLVAPKSSAERHWEVRLAEDVTEGSRFRGCVDAWEGERLGEVEVCGVKVPADTYLRFVGYYLAEGCTIFKKGGKHPCYQVRISQEVGNRAWDGMAATLAALPVKTHVYNRGRTKPNYAEMAEFVLCSKELAQYMLENFPGKAAEKFIPKHLKNLPKDQLRILLDAMVAGDGWTYDTPGKWTVYTTASSRLADDVQEIALKLGYAPRLVEDFTELRGKKWRRFNIQFSDGPRGRFPVVRCIKQKRGGEAVKLPFVKNVRYTGKVWCFTVPNHFLVVRRNGIVSVQGNSNANVSVRVLMSRYQTIRSQLELVWKNSVFRPMCEARDYWLPDRTGNTGDLPTKWKGGKCYYLDIPNFKWAKLNLLDDTAQKQFLMRAREKLEIPHSTFCELFDLDPEEIRQKLREEQGTEVDPVFIDTMRKAAQQPSVQSQVLQGRKPKEWVLEKETPEDAAKRQKVSKSDPGATGESAGAGAAPAGAGAAPQPAAPRPVPAAPAKPGAQMPTSPPAPTEENPNAGVRQSPI